jgi:hypothetical protein
VCIRLSDVGLKRSCIRTSPPKHDAPRSIWSAIPPSKISVVWLEIQRAALLSSCESGPMLRGHRIKGVFDWVDDDCQRICLDGYTAHVFEFHNPARLFSPDTSVAGNGRLHEVTLEDRPSR